LTYNRGLTTTIKAFDIPGNVSGDDLTLTGTPTFEYPEVGHDKNVSLPDAALGGADASNYTLTLPVAGATATISKADTTTLVTLKDNVTITINVNGVETFNPTGNVTISVSTDNGTTIPWALITDSPKTLSDGTINASYTTPGPGTYYFKVEYEGDINYKPSAGYANKTIGEGPT